MTQNTPGTPEKIRATYRLQFHEGFRLADALALVPYLSELGISHIYASPLLKACRHSQHGYDVCDPTQLNPELGTEADLEKLVLTLREHNMGMVLDIVPNHMAATVENPWWKDVLARGRDSSYAEYFDIDWDTPDAQTRGKILLPMLGEPYQDTLVEKKLKLTTASDGHHLDYAGTQFPVAFGSLPDSENAENINKDAVVLDDVIKRQNYRLTFWKEGDATLNYRRFFSITSLAGLRVEEAKVFDATHELLRTWVQNGWIDGLRVDHPDGLRDPAGYLKRLKLMAPMAWITVEKILEPGEALPSNWPVAGTTGYDFLNQLNAIFVRTESEPILTRFYSEFTGEGTDYVRLVRDKKLGVLNTMFAAEVERLLRILTQITAGEERWQDFSAGDMRKAMIELAADFPVYRIYGAAQGEAMSAEDKLRVKEAVQLAAANQPQLPSIIFEMLKSILTERGQGDLADDFAARFQQLTGPAMAKGVEDSAFYCFNRFISLNEVGGNPGQFGATAGGFHGYCAIQQADWPDTMLATATHDTKRGEDVRARLNVLSEIPEDWSGAVKRWSAMNEGHRTGHLPDRNIEYFIYQTLVGAWPISEERVLAYVEKAAREAGQHTSWKEPNAEYETALRVFATGLMKSADFNGELEKFINRIRRAGHINSLSQTLIKLTAPGIPDIYQGCELWDLSLVDPDNRRPVDFGERRKLLACAKALSAMEVWKQGDEPVAKLWLIWKVLNFRAAHPELFCGRYEPLSLRGGGQSHAIAYLREDGVITVVPRLSLQLNNGWSETALILPEGRWRNLLTGEIFYGPEVQMQQLLAKFPVALLVSGEKAA